MVSADFLDTRGQGSLALLVLQSIKSANHRGVIIKTGAHLFFFLIIVFAAGIAGLVLIIARARAARRATAAFGAGLGTGDDTAAESGFLSATMHGDGNNGRMVTVRGRGETVELARVGGAVPVGVWGAVGVSDRSGWTVVDDPAVSVDVRGGLDASSAWA
ncbi:hypothetical protein AG1IA_02137 [Rhizoctonia solani AG-1 IA]|uniref:Uncharacterized protein n=1 Tax=Thanatephorus cucumeris (strain AG1-IA) TaxID=983506 RepID=L8X0U2_THACA|nr:hypothetical protein AG1IA_02137 [Rhizoctonia solani AG-1 IA]